MTIHGVDISSWQGSPNLSAVAAAGIGFVIDKSTQGVSYINPRLATTWPAIKPAGMLRGAFHYAEPDQNTAADEAAYFLANTPLEPGDVIALDVEQGAGDLSAFVLRWFAAVFAATGANGWLYTNSDYLANHGLGIPAIANVNGLWLADWNLPSEPPAPPPFPFITCWQTGSGPVSGIAGAVDQDIFYGDATAWGRYAVPAPVPPVPTKPALTDADRYQLVKYVAGGSGVADLVNWLGQYQDVTT